MRYLYLIFILICAAFCCAQVLGYLGKRMAAGYGTYASPGFYGSNNNTIVNTQHEIFCEYTVKKRTIICVSGRLYKAVAGNNAPLTLSYSYGTPLKNYPEGIVDITGRNFSSSFKFFKKRHLAPWGKYFFVGAMLHSYTTKYDPTTLYAQAYYCNNYNDRTLITINDFDPREQKKLIFDIFFVNGRTRMTTDRIALDYGYNINFYALTKTVFNFGETTTHTQNYYVEETAYNRVLSVNAFNLFFKIGCLIL